MQWGGKNIVLNLILTQQGEQRTKIDVIITLGRKGGEVVGWMINSKRLPLSAAVPAFSAEILICLLYVYHFRRFLGNYELAILH